MMTETMNTPPAQPTSGRSTPQQSNGTSLDSAIFSELNNDVYSRGDKKEDDAVSVSSKTTAVASNVQEKRDSTPKKSNASPPSTLSTNKMKLAASSATRRMFRNRAKGKSQNRVAGGAAAKLMGPNASDATTLDSTPEVDLLEIVSTEESEGDFKLRDEKINEIRERAKEEWKKGTKENTRFFPTRFEDDNDESPVATPKTLPSALNRQEIFHETANAALIALLSPGKSSAVDSPVSNIPDDSIVSLDRVLKQRNYSAFRPPEEADNASDIVANSSVLSAGRSSVGGRGKSSAVVLDTTFNSRHPTAKPLISSETEKKVEVLKHSMQDPSKTLSDLLTSICSPIDGKEMDRGYMVRRKNACGALKVLTSKPENRKTICWTVGVLPALTSVLQDAGETGIEKTFPDKATRLEYVEARKRAVSNILNLAIPKENRFAVFHSVGLVKALLKTINEDDGESRQGCCTILAYLAKTVDNRLLMVHIPDFIDTLAGVINPEADIVDEVRAFLCARMASLASSGLSYFSEGEDKEVETMLTDDTATEGAYTSAGTDNDDSSVDDLSPSTTATSPHSSRAIQPYDKHSNDCLNNARQYVFAVFSHLAKEKENAFHLARHEGLIGVMVAVSKLQNSGSHKHAVEFLANLTRHRDNAKWLMFKIPAVVEAFVTATVSPEEKSRKFGCLGLQNLSQEKACRQEMGNTLNLLKSLCSRARYATDETEKLSAISALKNLTDEPSNLVPMTNGPECVATFMYFTDGRNDSITETMQYRACDGLAAICPLVAIFRSQ